MIRLPSNLRSLVLANYLRRSYATAVHAEKVNRPSPEYTLILPPQPTSPKAKKHSSRKPSSAKQSPGVVTESVRPRSPPDRKNRSRASKFSAIERSAQRGEDSRERIDLEKKPNNRIKKASSGVSKQSSERKPVVLDKDTLQDEKDAKTDIYNYAASAGLVPEFQTSESKREIRVTIKLPEQGIEVYAVGKKSRHAEVAACIKFKQEAEKYQNRQTDDTSTPQGFQLLTTETAEEFVRYVKIGGKIPQVEYKEGKPKSGHSYWDAWLATGNSELVVGEKVSMINKKKAGALAWLVAAIQIAKEKPQALQDFQRALSKGNGVILRPIGAMDLDMDSATFKVMQETMYNARRAGLPDMKDAILPTEVQEQSRRHVRPKATPEYLNRMSSTLAANLRTYLADSQLETLRTRKQALPMNQYKDKVLQLISNNIYSIVVGATGSGKTTQVPQILFDDAIKSGRGAHCNIICTQPRRIAATSVAQRVAVERNEKLGATVGYHVRFDRKVAYPSGSINFCTTGIILEQLKHGADEVFDSVSHLLIDEVHERDLNIDFLMIILKNAIKARQAAGKSVPKVVLMSATLDTELFAKYFNQSIHPGEITPCPSISVPGRTFPVKEKFLGELLPEMEGIYGSNLTRLLSSDDKCTEYIDSEKSYSALNMSASFGVAGKESVIDWKRRTPTFVDPENPGASAAQEHAEALVPLPLVAATLAHICRTSTDGAILVFLPGLPEITDTDKILKTRNVLGVDFTDTSKFAISILHSSIPKEAQSGVFESVRQGCRKIILSTNIAETSVTIPDVQYVIDTGKLREKRYDQIRRITKLQCTWVSKSNSKQRAGRAGRVQNGNYYALFTRERYEMLRTIGLPELLRSDLQETCLSTKLQRFEGSVADFLGQAIEPPSPRAVEAAVNNLKAMEAFTQKEELTPLGQLLAKLPVHPTLGKMIVLGVIFRCLDPLLILGAAAEERPLFLDPLERRTEARLSRKTYIAGQNSDHIALLNAFTDLRSIRDKRGTGAVLGYAREKFLHAGAFRAIDSTATQIHDILMDAGLIQHTSPSARHNSQYGHPDLNINSGNPELVKGLILAGYHPNLAATQGSAVFRSATESKIRFSQRSINKPNRSQQLVVYSKLNKASDGDQLLMAETSVVSPLTCALFGGRLERSRSWGFTMDKWLPIFVHSRDTREAIAATSQILYFKDVMSRILSNAFQSLSNLKHGDRGFFAYDKVREVFARGLVDILKADALNQIPPEDHWNSMNRAIQVDTQRRSENGEGRPRISHGKSIFPSRASGSPESWADRNTNAWRAPSVSQMVKR